MTKWKRANSPSSRPTSNRRRLQVLGRAYKLMARKATDPQTRLSFIAKARGCFKLADALRR